MGQDGSKFELGRYWSVTIFNFIEVYFAGSLSEIVEERESNQKQRFILQTSIIICRKSHVCEYVYFFENNLALQTFCTF